MDDRKVNDPTPEERVETMRNQAKLEASLAWAAGRFDRYSQFSEFLSKVDTVGSGESEEKEYADKTGKN